MHFLNATTPLNYAGGTDSLKMTIYRPVNDNNSKRPIMMFIHGGGFSGGNRSSFDAYCKSLAKRGFVMATITYRLGFYRPLVPNNYPYNLNSILK